MLTQILFDTNRFQMCQLCLRRLQGLLLNTCSLALIETIGMQQTVISIDVVGNTLTGAGQCVRLRHHQAGAFLAALLQRAERVGGLSEKHLCAAAMTAIWNDHLGAAEPDRTAMRRLVQAVQLGLLEAQSASQVLSLPRKSTVGPWWLEIADGEQWRVKTSQANRRSLAGSAQISTQLAQPAQFAPLPQKPGASGAIQAGKNPSLSAQREPAATLNAVAALVVADALARQAQYPDAVAHLHDQARYLNLSDEGLAVFELRKIRWLRRSGQRSAALTVLASAQTLLLRAHPLVRGGLTAEITLQAARLAYEANPSKSAHKLNFERLGQQIDQAGSPKLLWEVANLQALTLRRKLQALMARAVPAQLPTLQRVNIDVNDCFGAALFWLAVADDPYHLQSVLVNYAYHLQWPLQQQNTELVQSEAVVADVVKAWHLSQAIIEKFDLPEDSAWDFIMLADLWLGHSGARAAMQTDWRLWPSQRSPAGAAFYERAVALARQTGDERQQVLALDRCAAFCKESGDWKRAAETLKERNDLMAADAQLAAQIEKEVLWAGGGRDLNKL